MDTLSYIVKESKNHQLSYSSKKNRFQIFYLKIKGVLLSLKTTGFLSTFSFFIFTRKYKQIKVIAIACKKGNNKIRYFRSDKNSVSLRTKYQEEDIRDLTEINLEDYKSLGNIRKFVHIKSNEQKIWITRIISFLYSMRYKQMNNSSHLLGSGRFAAGVIVPNIIKNGGNILGIYKSIGNSATFLAESYGLNKNILIDELKPQLTNSYTNLFILSSPHKHVDDINNAIASGYKKIYCEKPAGISYEDLISLKEIANMEDIQLTFGFNRRFAPSIIYLKQLLKKIDSYHITYLIRLAEFSESMSRFKRGGGTTVCACCHYIDLLFFLNGVYKTFNVNEIINEKVNNIDGFSFEMFIKHSEKVSSSLRFIKANPGFKGKFQEQIIVSSDEDEIRINDFKEIYKNGLKLKRYNLDVKGWELMVKSFLSDKIQPSSSTLLDGIKNLELCLKIDNILNQSRKS